jgi:sigma-54 specific flagellar transcriptional regulator A
LQYTEIARPPGARNGSPVAPPATESLAALLDQGLPLRDLQRRIEVECIARALAESGGNITAAAQRLGMKRPRLSQLIKEHGIAVERSC